MRNFRGYFNWRSMMAGIALALTADATSAQAYDHNVRPQDYSDWDTLEGAGEMQPYVTRAKELLIEVDPVFEKIFAQAPLAFPEKKDIGPDNVQIASFQIVGETPTIALYQAIDAHEHSFSFFNHLYDRRPVRPDFDQYAAVSTALSIANETAHYLQYMKDTEFMTSLLNNGGWCGDIILLEQSSDEMGWEIATRLHQSFAKLDAPLSAQYQMAVTWSMESDTFLDFSKAMSALEYGDQETADEIRDAYLKMRYDQYVIHHNCAQGGKAEKHSKAAEKLAAAPIERNSL